MSDDDHDDDGSASCDFDESTQLIRNIDDVNVKRLFQLSFLHQRDIRKQIMAIEGNREMFENNLVANVQSRLRHFSSYNNCSRDLPNEDPVHNDDNFQFHPIDNENALMEFDCQLSNSDYMAKMVCILLYTHHAQLLILKWFLRFR